MVQMGQLLDLQPVEARALMVSHCGEPSVCYIEEHFAALSLLA